ncbi:MAG: helix-turn-helix domain-containing protein [Clostridiaceae bacterium]
MQSLIDLFEDIKSNTGIDFSVEISGNMIFGDGSGKGYALKLKNTYGYLYLNDKSASLQLLFKYFLESQINNLLDRDELKDAFRNLLSGKSVSPDIMSSLVGFIPTGTLFLIESKNTDYNLNLLREIYEERKVLLDYYEGFLVLFGDFQEPHDEAMSIYSSIMENTIEEPLVVHLGYPCILSNLKDQYDELLQFIKTGKKLFIGNHVYNKKDMLLEDFFGKIPEEIRNGLVMKYRRTLENLDLESRNTILAYVTNNMNLQKTAQELYIHRNTLNYRLVKLEKDFNLDLKNIRDLMILYFSILSYGENRD